MNWLHVTRSDTPLILAFPHGGTQVPEELQGAFRSLWWAARDADWHIRELYEGLADATMVWTDISRSVIDCNRDPSGASLYPGQATTELCPTTTFDGEPLYRDGEAPDTEARRAAWFTPYHAAIEAEISRLKAMHGRVVLYDCHSIRSRIPRLFDGELPELNLGTNRGATCAPELEAALGEALEGSSHVVNGRFLGGWTTRHYGRPERGVHAIQMEIAMRAYLDEPEGALDKSNWPPVYDPNRATTLRVTIANILSTILRFAKG